MRPQEAFMASIPTKFQGLCEPGDPDLFVPAECRKA